MVYGLLQMKVYDNVVILVAVSSEDLPFTAGVSEDNVLGSPLISSNERGLSTLNEHVQHGITCKWS